MKQIGLIGLIASALLSCGEREEQFLKAGAPTNQIITGLGTFTDMDYDGWPDVLYLPASSTPGSVNAYWYKEGYGPSQYGNEKVEIKFISAREMDRLLFKATLKK